jgi:hypothetical protein
MANAAYNTGVLQCLNNTLLWGTSDFRAMFLTAAGTAAYDADNDDVADIVANEISQGDRATLAGETIVQDDANDQIEFDCTDPVWTALAAGDTPDSMVVYLHTGVAANDILLCMDELTAPPAPNGGDYTVTVHADGVVKFSI